MKIKELQKTVNVAWSPYQETSIMLAAGTAAQQLDVNVSSVLEIYSANLLDPGYDLELKVSQPSQFKFQKIVWTPHNNAGAYQQGLIVGGCEGGHLQVFNSTKLLAGENGLVSHQDKHTGAIRGLDFNPFQNNLLASAASESEIFIWDLNNTTTPMAPGTKTQPLEDVQNVAWNRQVQHILCSVFSSRCVIWDLRKNEQIMKLSDSQSRVRWRAVQWHPEIATQLWLASEDDSAPYVQLWDLRYATAPAKTMQIHNRGILSLNWCPNDIDMMISCAKDNKIICWNPNSDLPNGEILGEIATTIQWYSDVQWCPRNPALIAGSSLEGNVSIYSLFGGTHHQVLTSNKIADSFPGMDQFTQVPVPQQTTQIIYQDLVKPPKWMKRKTGSSFSFGGKLLFFGDKCGNQIKLFQVITEAKLVERANSLEKTLEGGNFIDYCKDKADQMSDQNGRYLWYFIKANFEMNPREEMLNLLGYNKEDITRKFMKHCKTNEQLNKNEIESVTKKMAALIHSDSSEVEGDQSTDDSTDVSGVDNNALFEALADENQNEKSLTEKTEKFKIPLGESGDGLITEAILSGNIEAAVEICFDYGRTTEGLIIASTAGIDFLKEKQLIYLSNQKNELSHIITALVQNEWNNVMSTCSIESWKEALMAALTHSDVGLGDLCVKLGERLQESDDINLKFKALICYICAGNVEKLVEGWLKLRGKKQNMKLSTTELQDLVEIVMLFKKALELRGQSIEASGQLAEFLAQYAGILATQGALETALSYLGPTDDYVLEDLRDRLYYALGHKQFNCFSNSKIRSMTQNLYGRSTNNSAVSSILNPRFNQSRNSFSNPVPCMPQTNANNLNTTVPGQFIQSWNSTPPVNNNISSGTIFGTIPQNCGINQSFQLQSNSSIVGPPPLLNKNASKIDSINPPRPSSVGSQGSGPLSRKYVVDPSLGTAPTYGQVGAVLPATNTMLSGNTSSNTSYNSVYNNSNNANHTNFSNSISNHNFKPFIPIQTTSMTQGSGFVNTQTVDTAQSAMTFPRSGNRNPTPPPGWNDPPPLSSNRQPKSENVKVAPITHPIFGVVDPNQNECSDSGTRYQLNSGVPFAASNQSSVPQIFSPNQQSQENLDNHNFYQSGLNQMNFRTQATAFQQPQDIKSHHSLQPKNIEKALQKLALPEEYVYMQTVLEELKNKCLEIASDLRTKKKIQDVTKRLQFLYDALKDRRLSGNTITTLNKIVQFLQNGDYGNALVAHTQIVSGPDFSQTANFMPGLKVLVQTASELKAFLQ